MGNAALYLIPSLLDENGQQSIPPSIKNAIEKCQVFFVENERTTRRYLKKIWKDIVIDNYEWHIISKETITKELFRKKIKEGKSIGIISEAGCPGVADPGQELVALPPAVPLIKSGKLKALAVTSLKRLDTLPNVPTVSESGFSDFEDYTWVGLFAPAKLPNDLLNRLNGLINEAVRQPDFRDKLNAAGFEAQTGSPQYFNDYLKLELTKWGKIVKETGVSPQ